MGEINQEENNVVAIATMDIEGRTHLIETTTPFNHKKLIIKDKFISIGNLLFPKEWYLNLEMYDAEGYQSLKEQLSL